MTCKIRDQAQGPRFSSHPYRRLSVSKWIRCTIEPHQKNQKEVTTPEKHVLMPPHGSMSCCKMSRSVLAWAVLKNGCCRGFQQVIPEMQSLKTRWCQVQRPVVQQIDIDRWDQEKWPAVSLYLDELLIQKRQFRGHFKVSILCLDKHSPKGSCHLDESSMNHTLAQKHLCEFWCGMHRTCKNTVKPDRKWLLTRREKQCKRILSTSLLDAIVPSEPNRGLPNGMVVFWVSHFP